ncbi:EVI5-like protein [Sycon ciliatum]|uniref:EVI5-like protein n=1 Tax=Sycon ciliatum TaxID=27933 RepID=UPI0031F62B3B
MAEEVSSVEKISEEELLAKLEEQNRLLQQDSKVPNLPQRVPSTSSSTSISTSDFSPLAHHQQPPPQQQGPQPNRPVAAATSVLGSIISAVLHPDADKTSQGSASLASTPGEPPDIYQVWGELLSSWEDTQKRKGKQLQRLVRGGIPGKLRGLAWQLLSGAKNHLILPNSYLQLLERDSPCEKQIRRDLARTFPDHDFFKEKDSLGQEALFNVMKAYSLHDREVGYCQGSPFIVGLLLMQMPEEDAFGVLVRIMQEYRLRELFKPSMSELGVCLHQLDSLLQEHLTELYGHFQAQGFHSTMYASSWFLTLFSSALPLEIVFRIMDWFLLEGMEAVFRISIALLQGARDDLLNLDMEGMVKLLQNTLKSRYELEEDQEALFMRAFDLKVNSKKLKKAGKDFQIQRERETEESVENRRLRNENQILLHRIGILEEETQTLAQRLIEGQVTRANEAEEVFTLRREMVAVRKQLEILTESRSSTPNPEADVERLRQRVAQLEVDSQELTHLRRREADMASALASSQARIAELASQTVELCRLQRREAELAAEVSALHEDVDILREQLSERSRQLDNLELGSSPAAVRSAAIGSIGNGRAGSLSAASPLAEVCVNGVEDGDADC